MKIRLHLTFIALLIGNIGFSQIDVNAKKILDNEICYADSSLFNFFTFEIVEGDVKQALNKPYSIVLTESTAKKIFGKENAFGKMSIYWDVFNNSTYH